ncbi:MAG: T9SS type A sorting domain-containing protein [Dysgonamonadaceae bacterium]|jgi:N-acetylmuramoyl-L-alanine amidase|nr:T9SS type A sorting domain-containing protein [Dysgonamonadaceae bacterium]
MKKITFFLLVLLTSIAAQATDLTGIKIYINPGHGGYDSNDRSVWTIPIPETWTNPNGYWESKSNLVKGLALRDMLQAAGATVIMSRTDNTSGIRDGAQFAGGGDRDLSEIAEEANANNVDHFLSIHSNAMGTANSLTNHVLMLYHGDDGAPTVAASLPMAQSFGAIQQSYPLTVWQNSAPSIRGDFTFYGDRVGLGVLRPLTVPGFLSEGSFHDYAPETHRLCNNDFCKLEAMRMFRHFHNYFQRDMPAAATIAGWVKSENERVDVLNQPKFVFRAGSDDQWKPINGATVTLLSEDGSTELQTYTTDDWYNGIFAFYNLAAGKYKVRVEATGYESKTVDVTAVASDFAYAKVRLFNPDYALNSGLEPDYPELSPGGAVVLNHYDFIQQGATATFEALNGVAIKRVLFRNNKFYVLTAEPKILVYNAATQTALGELSLTGIEGGDVIVSDIAFTADGKLLGCNKATIGLPEADANNNFKVYKWDNDNAAPTLLFQSQKQGNWVSGIIGETFAVAGATDHLKLYTTAVTAGSSKQIRIVAFEYLAATGMLADKYMGSADQPESIYTEAEWGACPKFTISPSGSDYFIIDSDIMQATEYKFDWEQTDRKPLVKQGTFADTEAPVLAQGNSFARYAGHVFMAAPVCNADASGVGVALYDITAGLDNAVKISEKQPENGMGTTPAGAILAGIAVSGYDIELIILAQNQGVAHYKTQQNPVANIYASGLSCKNGKFTFTLNEDAVSVSIEIYNEGEWVQSYEAGALTKGTHSIDNPFGSTTFDSYGITATARPSVALAKISSETSTLAFTTPRGLAIDKNVSSPFFGHIYVSDSKNTATTGGIYVFDAALADVTNQGTTPWTQVFSATQYSPLRLSIAPDSRLVIADWDDLASSGVHLWNPATPATNAVSVFGGTVGANGIATQGDVKIHGSVSQAVITGSGVEAKLYTYDQDLSTILNVYNIGTLETPWIAAPSVAIPNPAGLANKRGSIIPDGKGGLWIGQHRWEDSEGNPGVMHLNAQGVRDFWSKKELTANSKYNTNGSIALNANQTLLATVSDNEIKVFEVSYSEAGLPSIPATPTYYLETTFGSSCWALDFDPAGNLYAAGDGKALHIWTFPKADNSYTTRAAVNKGVGIPAVPSAEVSIYPNPVVSELVIDGQGTTLNAYTLYDLNGRVIRSEKIGGYKFTVPAGGLNAGVYILQIQTAEGIITKRVIKK